MLPRSPSFPLLLAGRCALGAAASLPLGRWLLSAFRLALLVALLRAWPWLLAGVGLGSAVSAFPALLAACRLVCRRGRLFWVASMRVGGFLLLGRRHHPFGLPFGLPAPSPFSAGNHF